MPSTDQLTVVLDVSVTVALNCWELDGFKVAEVGLIETLTTGAAAPLPDKSKVVGLSGELSFTCKLPLRGPVATGVKVTLTLQVPPAGTLEPQFEVTA